MDNDKTQNASVSTDGAQASGTVITNIDEICAAIRATRDGVSMFSGTFGPGGLQGKFVTPDNKEA